MQEVFLKAVFYLSIIVNVLLFLRYIYNVSIVHYTKRKKRRETRLKRVIHKIVHDYLESIANSK